MPTADVARAKRGIAAHTTRTMEVRALTPEDAAAIASWRYPGRYATYDVDDPSVLDHDHWAVTDAGELVGYCCFGAPGRVAGAAAEDGTLDAGYGLEPERMGSGLGHRFVAAVLTFAAERYTFARVQLFVLAWNARSRRVAAGHGFAVARVVQSDEGPFLVMVRDA